MNLNQQAHFSVSPIGLELNRSTFDRGCSWTGTFNAGKLNCCFWDLVLPGDTKKMHVKALIRMTTPLAPVMDDCYLDEWAFFVPWRLVWSHLEEFFGANNVNYWIQPQEYTLPMIDVSSSGAKAVRQIGDIADQFGIPFDDGNSGTSINIANGEVNALIFRSYRLIWNEFFRDENTQSPKLINNGDTETDYTLLQTLPVNRIHDYFGSCLPGTQKHAAVTAALSGFANVYPTKDSTLNLDIQSAISLGKVANSGILWSTATNGNIGANYNLGTTSTANNGNSASKSDSGFTGSTPYPRNLIIGDGLGMNLGIDVNTLRSAIAAQRVYEALSLGGSRFTEILRSFWNITSPDARLQRPELLGHYKRRISMSEVAQSTPQLPNGNDVTTPLGTVGAFSKTYSDGLYFEKSFTEYGFLFVLYSVRTARSYAQGINSQLRAKSMLDIYNPKLAFLGEQPVYTSEIYASAGPNDILGYQEAFASYRYKPNLVSGYCSPAVPNNIAHEWTYCDYYTSQPTLSDQWMQEGNDRIQRSLAVQYLDAQNQVPAPDFIGQFVMDFKDTRAMPVYSVPGLMDHF